MVKIEVRITKYMSKLLNVLYTSNYNKKKIVFRKWLHQISLGVDNEPVMARQIAKSIGCSKNFRGNQVLNTTKKVYLYI
jgi:hypothetical protein